MGIKKIILGVAGLLIAMCCTINSAVAGGSVTIVNKTKALLYCYNQDFGANTQAVEITPFPIPVKEQTSFPLAKN
ncbi:MAG: hypothetical protein GY756_16540 [bacterium]|nr:hypothetical protein [bacterium]